MRLKALLLTGLGSILLASIANASDSTPETGLIDAQSSAPKTSAPAPQQEEDLLLEEIIVSEDSLSNEPLPNTGRVLMQPIPVRIAHSRPVLEHNEVDLIIRPVRLGEDGKYVSDARNRRHFARVRVSLNHQGVVPGSRRKRPDLGERALDLPEGLYAITEVRFGILRTESFPTSFGDLPPIYENFCLAEQTIAFDVKNGETTDIGRLVMYGLERRRKRYDFEYRPFLGADARFSTVSDPDFRNKAPEKASAAVISFDSDDNLCRKKSKRTAGWYTPEELSENIPNLVIASASTK